MVSLGHPAQAAPVNDPVYDNEPGSGDAGLPSLGSLLLQGESGAPTLQPGALTRVRSNPFGPLIEADVAATVDADLAVPAR